MIIGTLCRHGDHYVKDITVTAVGIDQLLYLLDEAFEGNEWHSLVGNLRDVGPEDWRWIPPSGRRSILSIVRPRRTNWGELMETRWIIAVMIQHDLYHAGEINHLRSLRQRTDRWEHEREA